MGRHRKQEEDDGVELPSDGCSTLIDGQKVEFPSCLTCPLPKCRFEVNGFQSATMLRAYLEKKVKV